MLRAANGMKPRMPRILIVEDNDSLRTLIEVILEDQGYTVVQACNGLDAYQMLRRDARFDAIVSDIFMPEMDGLSLLSLVKQSFPTIPVILASAYLYQLQRARKLGAARHLLKPFSNSQLVEAVRSVLPSPACAGT
jgi:CheY-like chemotaxis protein